MFKHLLRFVLLVALAVPLGTRAQITLPYSCGFEDEASIAAWTLVNQSTANAAEFGLSTEAAKTGTYGFRFSSYSTSASYHQYLISPEISTTNSMLVGFSYVRSS